MEFRKSNTISRIPARRPTCNITTWLPIPNEVGKKDELIRAEGDTTYYAQVHERYHESLRSLLKTFDFYYLFLIDHETGDIIYTVYKETDFGTSLRDGPYASSNLAALVEKVMRTKEQGRWQTRCGQDRDRRW